MAEPVAPPVPIPPAPEQVVTHQDVQVSQEPQQQQPQLVETAPVIARGGSRFAPRCTLEELIGGRGRGTGLFERGARGGRGRATSQPSVTMQALRENAGPANHASFPSLPPAAPDAHVSQQPQQQQQQQQQKPSQVGARSFAAVTAATPLAPLVAAATVPPQVLAVIGLKPGAILPQLPKVDAHRYEVSVPFVTRAAKNFDNVEMYLNEEFGFRHLAMRRASRVVIVRTTTVTDSPFIFLYDIGLIEPAGMISSRIMLQTIEPRNDTVIEGLEPPQKATDHENQLYVLQGTLEVLKKWADRVVVRSVIGGRTDEERIYDAVGVPKDGWKDHLLGAPLNLVQEYRHAPRRATVKPTFVKDATLWSRFCDAGMYHKAYGSHLVGCYLAGFNIRIVIKGAFTSDHKRYFGACEGVSSVYTDVKTMPTPPRVTKDQPTMQEMDIAAHEVEENEVAMHGGIVSTAVPPPDLFQRIAVALKIRVVRKNAVACVFGVPRDRVAELDNRTFSGWVRLACERHG